MNFVAPIRHRELNPEKKKKLFFQFAGIQFYVNRANISGSARLFSPGSATRCKYVAMQMCTVRCRLLAKLSTAPFLLETLHLSKFMFKVVKCVRSQLNQFNLLESACCLKTVWKTTGLVLSWTEPHSPGLMFLAVQVSHCIKNKTNILALLCAFNVVSLNILHTCCSTVHI